MPTGNSAACPIAGTASDGNQTLLLTLAAARADRRDQRRRHAGLNLSGDALALFPYTAAALANDPAAGRGDRHQHDALQHQRRAHERHQRRRQPAEGAADLLAIHPRRFRRHAARSRSCSPIRKPARSRRVSGCCAPMPIRRANSRCGATEFVGNINNKGRVDADGTLTNYKDHGFGFAWAWMPARAQAAGMAARSSYL